MSAQDPTADYRKYPKGPNFLVVVIGFAVAILIIIVLSLLFLKHEAPKAMPHSPNANPNSLVQPLLPSSTPHVS